MKRRKGGDANSQSITQCNCCGDCCDPVVLREEQIFFLEKWANQPDPEKYPGNYPDYVTSTPEGIKQAREHIANGTFMLRYWLRSRRWRRKRLRDGVVFVGFNCPFFDSDTRLCTAHEKRPPMCSGFPWYEYDPRKMIAQSPDHLPSIKCAYWADVPLSMKPKGWKPLSYDDIERSPT